LRAVPPGRWNLLVALASIFLLSIFLSSTAPAQESQPSQKSTYNVKAKTLGGTQYWTDLRVVGRWRVQHNSYFGHFRLLDPENTRHVWGKKSACMELLDEKIKSGRAKPYSGKVVILLHGLMRSYNSMQPMAEHLEKQGFQSVLFRYASSRKNVASHANYLNHVIQGLGDDVTEINFVGHSLGNIVVRQYVGDCKRNEKQKVDPRIKRMVMLGPPNQGSRMARLLRGSIAFKLVAGASGLQLSQGWKELESKLGTPPFEFGIIAGGQSGQGWTFNNYLLPGKDDFTVSVEETKLVGARDFHVDALVHSNMMKQQSVLEKTSRFLNSGHFISDSKRNPIKSLKSLKSEAAIQPTRPTQSTAEATVERK